MNMINKERVQLLVDALRSGKYQQGRGILTRIRSDGEQQHCCLGLACVVAMNNGLEIRVQVEKIFVRYDGRTDVLPDSVQNWYGFDSNNPILIDGVAVSFNDSLKAPFTEIANLFERTYITGV